MRRRPGTRPSPPHSRRASAQRFAGDPGHRHRRRGDHLRQRRHRLALAPRGGGVIAFAGVYGGVAAASFAGNGIAHYFHGRGTPTDLYSAAWTFIAVLVV